MDLLSSSCNYRTLTHIIIFRFVIIKSFLSCVVLSQSVLCFSHSGWCCAALGGRWCKNRRGDTCCPPHSRNLSQIQLSNCSSKCNEEKRDSTHRSEAEEAGMKLWRRGMVPVKDWRQQRRLWSGPSGGGAAQCASHIPHSWQGLRDRLKWARKAWAEHLQRHRAPTGGDRAQSNRGVLFMHCIMYHWKSL